MTDVITENGENDKNKSRLKSSKSQQNNGKLFSLKKWNVVAMWRWDVECDTCAICRVPVQGKAIRPDWDTVS